MIREAIILAGGLGTRLRQVVHEVPKCLAPVNNRPFLGYVIDYWSMQGIEKFIFSVGYKWELIRDFVKNEYPTLACEFIIENEPLGTGGAIRLSVLKASQPYVLITNGDTLFKASLTELSTQLSTAETECLLALKPMKDFDRYGVVEISAGNKIITFHEKQYFSEGLINGGVYILNTSKFSEQVFPTKFSFEKDYLEKYFRDHLFYGCIQNGYFIDIGIPEDYHKAGMDMVRKPLDLNEIDNSWTLFLDRDGVINEEKVGEYILTWKDFVFSKGVLDVFKKLSSKFGRIILVSNQRGVSKLLMSEADLQSIHFEMQREVEIAGGRIDKIYYCTDKDDNSFNRKPNPGMAVQAMKDFKDIDPQKSVMVGNKPSDMKFGRTSGFYTIFIASTNPDQPYPHQDIDLMFDSLAHFAADLP